MVESWLRGGGGGSLASRLLLWVAWYFFCVIVWDWIAGMVLKCMFW